MGGELLTVLLAGSCDPSGAGAFSWAKLVAIGRAIRRRRSTMLMMKSDNGCLVDINDPSIALVGLRTAVKLVFSEPAVWKNGSATGVAGKAET